MNSSRLDFSASTGSTPRVCVCARVKKLEAQNPLTTSKTSNMNSNVTVTVTVSDGTCSLVDGSKGYDLTDLIINTTT